MMNNVLVRMIIYILSPILATGVAMIPGWGVGYNVDTHTLTISLTSLVTAVVTAFGVSGAIFAKWGIK